MSVKIVRIMFVIACAIMGGVWAGYVVDNASAGTPQPVNALPMTLLGAAIGGGLSVLVLVLLRFVSQEVYERLAPALNSIVLGLVIGYFVAQYVLWYFPNADLTLRVFVVATFVLIFGFVGISLGITRASSWDELISVVQRNKQGVPSLKLVDTSVIIDGRIADICDSGFIEGTLLVPRFVLAELQNIADSPDLLRRAKGRRGLDILKRLQDGESLATLEIIDDDPKDAPDVDSKLVRLAKKLGAKVLTNDYNLNKVAQIEGAVVLNINDLANALKPAVLPDEKMEVKIIKEGKEPSQGVGYLDDGTMIVVDGGREHMTKKVEVIVTSVLQTAAGRMIFTRFNQVLS